MHRRQMLVVLAGTFTLTAAAVAMAGSPTKAAKKTFTGVIENVNIKQQTITVKAPEVSQQIQTQTGPAKAPSPRLVFRIDAQTSVAAKAAKADTTQGPAGQQPSKISLLRAGQLVRVVYGETVGNKTAKPIASTPGGQQVQTQSAPTQATPAPQTPAQQLAAPKATKGPEQGPKQDLTPGVNPTAKKAEKASLAISVEILSAMGKVQAGRQAGTSATPPVLQPADASVTPAGSSNPVPPAPPAVPASAPAPGTR